MIDEHGHTFEKSAIEDHLKRNSQCPISREPIKTLSPNRLIKDQVEELRAQDPIPTLGSCKQENLSLAEKTMQMARHFAEAGEFEEAVNTFKKALNYTNRIKDYQELSEIYKQMGEVDKAELAEIFLLKYQLERGQIEQAITTLEKMLHRSVELSYLLAILYLGKRKPGPLEALAKFFDEQNRPFAPDRSPTSSPTLLGRPPSVGSEKLRFSFST